jgi:undecaprenyl-diphosphatase
MGDLIQTFIDTVSANQHLAYGLVCALSFSESLPVIGSLIPGTTIIIGIAALVASGAVDIWWLLGAAIVGAILGDGFSYWIGMRYHEEIVGLWPLNRYPQLIASARAAIEKHGGKSIFIARFTPAIRAILPMVAGILRMPPGKFYFVNVVSAFAWAIAHIVPAVIAGASLALAGAVGGRLLALIVAVVAVLWLILALIRYLLRRGVPWIASGLASLWRWARAHDNWVSREILSLLDPGTREIKGLSLLIACVIFGAWALIGFLLRLASGDPIARADLAVFNFMQGLRTLWGDRLMIAITELGDTAVTLTVATAVALWLAGQRAWRALGYWLGAIAAAFVYVRVLTLIVQLPRTQNAYRGADVLGLPPAYIAVTATVYGLLALLIARELKPTPRLVLASGAAFLVTLIAFSEIYLGSRWLSGIIAGVSFAFAWIGGLGIVYLAHLPRPIKARGLLGLALATFVAAGAVNWARHYERDLRGYAVHMTPIEMTAATWWNGGWASLPARRIDLAGGLKEPIAMQWVGSVDALKKRLKAAGWSEPPEWSLVSALGWLQPGTELGQLPVLTRLHNGRPARLILVHSEPDERGRPVRAILRLWRSNVDVPRPGGTPARIWLGMVVDQRLYQLGDFLSFGLTQHDENAPEAGLVAAMAPARTVYRKTAGKDLFGWNGWVILAEDGSFELPPNESPAPADGHGGR